MNQASQWDAFHAARRENELSWYQAHPKTSLDLIANLGIGPDDALIDVGGGVSNLVDHLLDRGFTDVSVLDISATALAAAKARLGVRAANVQWLTADITRFRSARTYRLWHDRAVFHFLTEAQDRAAYVSTLSKALSADGYAVIATFAEDGPQQCSNLQVCRYSPEQLSAELGEGFVLLESRRETHVTPTLARQNFVYCCFRRR